MLTECLCPPRWSDLFLFFFFSPRPRGHACDLLCHLPLPRRPHELSLSCPMSVIGAGLAFSSSPSPVAISPSHSSAHFCFQRLPTDSRLCFHAPKAEGVSPSEYRLRRPGWCLGTGTSRGGGASLSDPPTAVSVHAACLLRLRRARDPSSRSGPPSFPQRLSSVARAGAGGGGGTSCLSRGPTDLTSALSPSSAFLRPLLSTPAPSRE